MASAAKQPAIRPRPQSPTKTGLKLAVSDMELMFELEMQSAGVKALGVDDLLE